MSSILTKLNEEELSHLNNVGEKKVLAALISDKFELISSLSKEITELQKKFELLD
jgi:hypothetical protein